jgi:nitric oxide dioxygenase
MITQEQKSLIKATVPFLRENGVALTDHFYKRMFKHNPELRNVFNMGNQQNGKQQTALAMAVLAYADNIDNPAVLMPVVDGIGHKHVSLSIRPEHYLIVGEHLLAAIAEVVGSGATAELLKAWEVAYFQLADLMSGHEASLYRDKIGQVGGWSGWRPFLVKSKIIESTEITSFYLYPADGGAVAEHKPGQYISVKVFLPKLNLFQPRQYSISTAPNGKYYRISVKKELSSDPNLNGMISNYFHDNISEGDLVDVSSPSGVFTLKDSDRPAVFISGGVGQTPLIAMMEQLINSGSMREKVWIHGSKTPEAHAFNKQVSHWTNQDHALEKYIFYNSADGQVTGDHYSGWVELKQLKKGINADADFYLCGPKPFIEKQYNDLLQLGVNASNIHYEEFGPQSLQLN